MYGYQKWLIILGALILALVVILVIATKKDSGIKELNTEKEQVFTLSNGETYTVVLDKVYMGEKWTGEPQLKAVITIYNSNDEVVETYEDLPETEYMFTVPGTTNVVFAIKELDLEKQTCNAMLEIVPEPGE